MATRTEHNEDIQKLADLIKGIIFAMMTTMDADGTMHSRPMATQENEFDGGLWFFTDMPSGKTREILHNQQVNVNYVSQNRYISVSGVAILVKDQAKMDELWSSSYKEWFPNGPKDPNLALIQVKVTQAEYWETPASPVVKLANFVKAITKGERPDEAGGENEKIDL